jgi:hypothetical protein
MDSEFCTGTVGKDVPARSSWWVVRSARDGQAGACGPIAPTRRSATGPSTHTARLPTTSPAACSEQRHRARFLARATSKQVYGSLQPTHGMIGEGSWTSTEKA